MRGVGRALLVAMSLGLVAGWPAAGRGDEPELPDSADFSRSQAVLDTLPAVAEPFRAGESLRFTVQ